MPGTKTAKELFQEFENIMTNQQTNDEKNKSLMLFLNKNKDKKANVDCKKSNGKTLLEGSIQNSHHKQKLTLAL
ncbi:MAG: hypothetical protein PG981_000646 [Wolbachia endosymbiont of Ctenocephalides orientis wCori]|nr:MAG: hypothetical protein PG981_000646 [Wolbachia endosymbiont of Ctenocephalides orientis wCori]